MKHNIKYNRIKEVLCEKGVKQIWLAEQLGKTFRQVNSYVTNTSQPSIPVLYEIARILNVSPNDLLRSIEELNIV
ncbi:MAG: helix-turn-helix transcriptional regulator [Bacilli bacterium]|nr:helix-turn-helix transcriptional regulator [Bacilli bacterium]